MRISDISRSEPLQPLEPAQSLRRPERAGVQPGAASTANPHQNAEPAVSSGIKTPSGIPLGFDGKPAVEGVMRDAGYKAEIRDMKRIGALRCATCDSRRYQDGSDDNGVSFQSPTHISPQASVGAVRSHENEHVRREGAKAKDEDRRVVSQSVAIHMDTCPECGRAYASGGLTKTVTKAETQKDDDVFMNGMRGFMAGHFGNYVDGQQ